MKPRLVAHFELLLATIGAEPQDLGASFCAFSGSADDLNKKYTGNNAFQSSKEWDLGNSTNFGTMDDGNDGNCS